MKKIVISSKKNINEISLLLKEGTIDDTNLLYWKKFKEIEQSVNEVEYAEAITSFKIQILYDKFMNIYPQYIKWYESNEEDNMETPIVKLKENVEYYKEYLEDYIEAIKSFEPFKNQSKIIKM